MKQQYNIELDEDIIKKFNMALVLANEEGNEVIENFMREYIALKFSMAASSVNINEKSFIRGMPSVNSSQYGKALNKIPKWATKQTQIPYKIVRAYLQLKDNTQHVSLSNLESRCSDERNHADVYVKNFSTNFAQMKLDSEKSHGKVFEVNEVEGETYVHLWQYIEPVVLNWKEKFVELRSTDMGYVNKQRQKNLGKTEKKGTGYGQMLYQMECLECHHLYYANGHDIFLKCCPKCQGGADTGNM